MVILNNQSVHYSPVDDRCVRLEHDNGVNFICNTEHEVALCLICNKTVKLMVNNTKVIDSYANMSDVSII